MPIHVAITRRVRAGREAEFEAALREFVQASLAHGGVLGVHMLAPPPGSRGGEYGILRSFADADERDAFYASPFFAAWQSRVAPLTEGDPGYRELSGLEAWFRSERLPPRWKMALATLIGVYPTSLVLSLSIGELVSAWPFALRALAIAVSMVAVLTWLAMPLVTRALHGWLHAQGARRTG